jgi:Ca2+-transporting ATPase
LQPERYFSENVQVSGSRPPYALPAEEVAVSLETDIDEGLTEERVVNLLQRYGRNVLREEAGPSFWKLLIDQFTSFLIVLLIGAALISAVIGEYLDAIVIIAIVALNATIGVVQERRASDALRALQKIAAGRAKVIREGRVLEVLSENLVPGDIVLLETGNFVPADLRLVEAVNLQINEASLTGESEAVEKSASVVLDPSTPLGDLANSAFLGTIVTRGRGRGIVIATGMRTEIGEIAEALQTFEEQVTPLQRRLSQLGQILGYAVLAIAVLVLGLGVLQGRPLLETFLVAVSLAVAAIPEGLPAVVTVVLAIGLQRMARRHALIRRLPAVETLGSVTVIASDKTGTLTKGEMTVVRLYVGEREIEVSGEGYRPEGKFRSDGSIVDPAKDAIVKQLLLAAVLTNDAVLEPSGRTNGQRSWRIIGDPTEGALLVVGGKAGLWRKDLDKQFPRRAEVPFSSERKLMTTVHDQPESKERLVFVKGAPIEVLKRSTQMLLDGATRKLTEQDRQTIIAKNDQFASDALRVLGVAYRTLSRSVDAEGDSIERDLTFVGLIGMIDPPRTEARDAIALARRAGIRPVMITGDYKRTAVANAD